MRTIRVVAAWTMPGAKRKSRTLRRRAVLQHQEPHPLMRILGWGGEDEETWKLVLFVRRLPKLTRMKSSR